MYCIRCGRPMQASEKFCAACGRPVRDIPLMPVQSRIAGHIRLLAIFWIAISTFRILPALVLAAIFGSNPDFPPGAPEFVHNIVLGVAAFLFLGGAFGIAAGVGLLNRAQWARGLAIVLGCIGLIDMPFGTALGAYTLWVLLPAESEQEYQQISRAA
jgi:4-amino-4-deoxy-L-arabinose transferase-like glycosyltransferase